MRDASNTLHPTEVAVRTSGSGYRALPLQHVRVLQEGSHLGTRLRGSQPQIPNWASPATIARALAVLRGPPAPSAQLPPRGGATGERARASRRHRRAPPPALLLLRGRSCWRQWIPSPDNGFLPQPRACPPAPVRSWGCDGEPPGRPCSYRGFAGRGVDGAPPRCGMGRTMQSATRGPA